MKPMRQADGLQTFFIAAAIQADVDSISRRDGDLIKYLRCMLPWWYTYENGVQV